MKPLFINREIIIEENHNTLEENEVLKNDPKETTEVFNNSYINIAVTQSAVLIPNVNTA